MDAKTVAKVGAVVVVAIALFVGLYLYLSHINPNAYTVRVRFDDTKGLLRQSVVRMQGVVIGEVKEITLDTSRRPFKPVVALSIENKYSIPDGSKFYIISGILITNPTVEVEPSNSLAYLPKNNTAMVEGGQALGALSSISPELEQTVAKVTTSFDQLNRKINVAATKLNRILDQTSRLLTTANETVTSTKTLVTDKRLRASLLTSVQNIQDLTATTRVTAAQLSRDLRELVASGKGKFNKLSDNLLDLLTKVGTTVDQVNTIVARLTEEVTDPRLQQALQETVELSRTTLARFSQIASDIHQLTGSPELQTDLKATVANLRATTEETQQAMEKVNTILGNLVGPGGKSRVPRLRIPHPELVSNVSEQFNPSRLRIDLDARFGLGRRNYLDMGLYDLGENTRLNLQLGNQFSDTLTARYGLYASKLGIGLDWTPIRGAGLRADLWDANHPRLDVRGLFKVNSDASVWIGADNLFREPVPVIGVQFRH